MNNTKLGQFESNNIYLGNAYELIKSIPDKSIDIIYTDPPYDFHCGTIDKSGIFKNRIVRPNEEINKNGFDKGIDNSILDEFVRIMKHIYIYIWCNKEQIPMYLNYFLGFKNISFEILMWHKENCTPLTRNTYLPDTEYCLMFREKGYCLLNDGYELKHKYFITNTNKEDKDNYGHPTIKPIEFVKKHLLHSTKENDVVFDPFIGSGTTAVAAKELGRQFIGFEINEKYYQIAKDRLNGINQKGEMNLFETDFDKVEPKQVSIFEESIWTEEKKKEH